RALPSFPTRRSSDLLIDRHQQRRLPQGMDFLYQRLQLHQIMEIAAEQDHAADLGMAQAFALVDRQLAAAYPHHELPQPHRAFLLLTRGDRKSTRLNSSHVKISYAVFC